MRHALPTLAVLLAATACTPPTPVDFGSTNSRTGSPQTTAAWSDLAMSYSGFMRAVADTEFDDSDTDPLASSDAENISATVGYDYSPGVTLETWSAGTSGALAMCLTGPANTYLTVTTDGGITINRTFGVGSCDFHGGNITTSTIDGTPQAVNTAAAVRDAKKVARTLEKFYGTNPGSAGPARLPRFLRDAGVSLSADNRVVGFRNTSSTASGYRFCVLHDSGAYATYTELGGLRRFGTQGRCLFRGDREKIVERVKRGQVLARDVIGIRANPLVLAANR